VPVVFVQFVFHIVQYSGDSAFRRLGHSAFGRQDDNRQRERNLVACESPSVLKNVNCVLKNVNCVSMSCSCFFLFLLFFSSFVLFRRRLVGRGRRRRLVLVSAAACAKMIRESGGTLPDKTTMRAHQRLRFLVRRREGLICRQRLQLFHLSCSVNSTVFILFQPLSLFSFCIVASLRRARALVIFHVRATTATFVDLWRRIPRFQGFENGVDLNDVVVDILGTQAQIKSWHACGDAVESVLFFDRSYGTAVLWLVSS
jgi:hypothetical protein